MTNFHDTPPFAEEVIIPEEQLNLQNILAKFNKLVPTNFVRLETLGENYMRSTSASWPKPICERYNFLLGEDWITLDIPQEIMAKLELKLGEEITSPIYLLPEVLKRKEVCKGITLENENEIFIQKPLTIKNLEKELNKWSEKIVNYEVNLSHYRLTLLSSLLKNAHKSQQIIDWKIKAVKLGAEVFAKVEEISNKDAEITTLQIALADLKIQIDQLTTKLNNLQTNLETSDQTNNDLHTQISHLTNQVNSLSLRPTQEQLTQSQQEKNVWVNNYSQLIKNVSNILLPEATTKTIATTDTLLLQQVREVIAKLVLERQTKEQTMNERDDRPNITLALWDNDYSRRPTKAQFQEEQKNITELKNEMEELKERFKSTNEDFGNRLLKEVGIEKLIPVQAGLQMHNIMIEENQEEQEVVKNLIKFISEAIEKINEINSEMRSVY